MRLIDIDKATDRYYAEWEKQDICDGRQDRNWLMRCIEEEHTVDAVPVIRCKNCKHFAEFRAEAKKDGADGTCRLLIMKVVENEFSSVKATDFCSYGERKEGADNG